LFDDREGIIFLIELTKEFWKKKSNNYEILISEQTILELSEGNYPNKIEILKFISGFQVLPYNVEITDIVNVYTAHKIMPVKDLGDSFHLAYASFYKIDYLFTWNYIHLANTNKQHQIRLINNRLGISVPEIVTPMQLMEE
jgi:predicted nucleic acid-binding protein